MYLKDILSEYVKQTKKGKVISQTPTEHGVIEEIEFTWDEMDDLGNFIEEHLKKEEENKKQTDFQMRWI